MLTLANRAKEGSEVMNKNAEPGAVFVSLWAASFEHANELVHDFCELPSLQATRVVCDRITMLALEGHAITYEGYYDQENGKTIITHVGIRSDDATEASIMGIVEAEHKRAVSELTFKIVH